MNKKIINIFFALAVVVIPPSAQADELGKIIGTTLGTVISVVSFSPLDRLVALTALTQLGGYFGSKVDIMPPAPKQQASSPLPKEKVAKSFVSEDSKDVQWYARNLVKEDDAVATQNKDIGFGIKPTNVVLAGFGEKKVDE